MREAVLNCPGSVEEQSSSEGPIYGAALANPCGKIVVDSGSGLAAAAHERSLCAPLNGPRNDIPAILNFDGDAEVAEPSVRALAAMHRYRIFLSTGAADVSGGDL